MKSYDTANHKGAHQMSTNTQHPQETKQAGHTPGPHRVQHVDLGGITLDEWYLISEHTGGIVGRVYRESDAELFASAPALLAQRDALLAALERLTDMADLYWRLKDEVSAARAAIATARGE